ncbi:hypothetical protein [Pseudohaliea rubra]
MLIGVPKEIKNHEYRIGLTPAGVTELVDHGHQVMIEAGGGAAIGFADEQYSGAGAGDRWWCGGHECGAHGHGPGG